MADEITISASLAMDNDGVQQALRKLGLKFDMTGEDFTFKTQVIGTSEEALVLGEVGTPGFLLIINRDPTNYVSIRRAAGEGNFCKLRANGGVALVELESTAPFAIANTAPCPVEYLLLEA